MKTSMDYIELAKYLERNGIKVARSYGSDKPLVGIQNNELIAIEVPDEHNLRILINFFEGHSDGKFFVGNSDGHIRQLSTGNYLVEIFSHPLMHKVKHA